MSMQAQDPKEVVFHYLLHSTRLEDDRAQSDSIAILTAHEMDEDIFYIVSYVNLRQQQLYASMKIHQIPSGFWEFVGFGMMGGTDVADLPQKPPLQIAWAFDLYRQASFVSVAVLPNEIKATTVHLKDSDGHIFVDQLENNAVFFILPQKLQKPLSIELFDQKQKLLSQHRIGVSHQIN